MRSVNDHCQIYKRKIFAGAIMSLVGIAVFFCAMLFRRWIGVLAVCPVQEVIYAGLVEISEGTQAGKRNGAFSIFISGIGALGNI